MVYDVSWNLLKQFFGEINCYITFNLLSIVYLMCEHNQMILLNNWIIELNYELLFRIIIVYIDQ